MSKLAKTPKGRATHAIKEPLADAWYASHGWHHRSVCGELVGKAVGEGEPTCKDCIAAIDRAADRYRPVRKAIEELEFLLGALPEGEELPHELRWRLHVLAASRDDFTFWVEQIGRKQWQAIEVETGVAGSSSTTAKGAMMNYWREHS